MYRFRFCLLCLLPTAFAPAAPVPTHLIPKEDPICYPRRVGDSWVHQLADSELTGTVTKVEKVDGGTRVTSELKESTRQTSYFVTVIVSPRGVQVIEYAGQKIDPPVWWLKLPHGPKNEWTGTWPGGLDFAFETKEWEVVEVPAGKFKAIRVERHELQNGTKLGTTTYWYAPGVGCIKIAGRSPARAMKSFTPGKG